MKRLSILVAASMAALAASAASAAETPPNILFIIADDYGTDAFRAYARSKQEAERMPATPTLERLASQGVVFDKAWAYPACSPTRAAMLSGRYAFRTGVGFATGRTSPPTPRLALDEVTLPEAFKALGQPHALANIGKWHVSGDPQDPNRQGWDRYAGFLEGDLGDYYNWTKVTDGTVQKHHKVYATTDQANEAIAFIDKAEKQRQPWFVWLGLTAPHTPYQLPPSNLHSKKGLVDDPKVIGANPGPYYDAMIEAMDREIARVLEHVDLSNTYVIFIGDNGSFGPVIRSSQDPMHGKFTLYEGGVRVPLFVTGPGISGGRRSDALVSAVDMYATILDLVGAARSKLPKDVGQDSISFASVLKNPKGRGARRYSLTEAFLPAGAPVPQPPPKGTPAPAPNSMGAYRQYFVHRDGEALRDERWKLIRLDNGARELYDLHNDPMERHNLVSSKRPDAQDARKRLEAVASTMIGKRRDR